MQTTTMLAVQRTTKHDNLANSCSLLSVVRQEQKINTKSEHQEKSHLWRQRREELCLMKCAAIRLETGYSCEVFRPASPVTRSDRSPRGSRLLRVWVTDSLTIKVAGEEVALPRQAGDWHQFHRKPTRGRGVLPPQHE